MTDTFTRIGLFRTIISVVATRVGAKVAVLVSFLLLGWALEAKLFGYFAVISASFSIAFQFANFGLRQASSYFIGQNPECENAVLRAIALFSPVAVVAFVLVVWGLVNFRSMAPIPPGWPAMVVSAGLGAVALSFAQGINLGRGEIGILNLSGIVQQGSAAFVVLLLVGLSFSGVVQIGLSLAVFSTVIGFISGGVFGVSRILPAAPRRPRDAPPLRMLGALLRHGWLYAVVLLLLTINSRLAVFFLANTNPVDAGQYFVAQRLSEAFLEIASAVGLVLFSLSSRSKNPVEVLSQSGGLTRVLIVMALVTGAVLVLLVPELVRRVFAQSETIGLLPILLLGATLPFTAFNSTIYQALAGLGQPGIGGIGYGAAVLLNGIVSATLTPRFGIAGAVSGFLVGQITVTVVLLSFIRHRYGLSAGMFLFIRKSDFVRLREEWLRLLRKVEK